jgi:Peptidase family M28
VRRLVTILITLGTTVAFVAAADESGKRWWSTVEALSNDSMRGRLTGSPEHRQAAEYAIAQFEQAGLTSAGSQGFMQSVAFSGRKIVEAQSAVALVRNGTSEPIALGEDATVNLRFDPADSVEAPLVFAGYGLVVPEMKYDDFAGLDLKGKIIVTIAGGPSRIPGNLRAHYGYPTERGKFLRAAGVVGLITIQNPARADIPWSRSSLARFQESMTLADPALIDMQGLKISLTVNPAHADKWLAGTGHTIAELLKLVDAGKPLPRFPLLSSLKATIKVDRRQLESQNVVAVRAGTDPALKNEYVVLSAHIDHLGVGEAINGDTIYNGAMDNASGVASLIEVARALQESKTATRRSLLFVLVTGEEKGLQGSRYFAAHPTVPIDSLVADINVDMFLPLYPLRLLTVYGVNESDLGDSVRALAKTMKVDVQDDPAPARNIFVRSDQYNFIRRGVPSVMVDVGNRKGSKEEAIERQWLESRYHAPSDDTQQPIDLQAAADFNRAIATLVTNVANAPARPQWKRDSFFRRFAGK